MRDDLHLHRVDYHSYPALRGEIMTTAQQLIHHDIAQSNHIMQRYYKSSSLPFIEKRKHKPEVCKYRRDRVLHAIMNREMERVLRIIGAG
ncbi:hypothetical protein QLG07_02455, partial [Erwinia sp. V90_4]|uniref:DUF7301 family protein n=1 Tax=Erwinia sp. V90_4 TaxID=3044239 RepID=UPI00249E1EF8